MDNSVELDLLDLVRRDLILKGENLEYVAIPSGTGLIQEIEEYVSGFNLMKYAVTQEQWVAIMETNPSKFRGSNLPVERVNRKDIQKFIKKINENSKVIKVRLPTEVEWEYACRAGTTTEYFFGDSMDKTQANFENDNGTVPVDSFQPNAWGLYNMHGNVWEWTVDYWNESYESHGNSPASVVNYSKGVIRGGDWSNARTWLRSTSRNWSGINGRYSNQGFRLVIELL